MQARSPAIEDTADLRRAVADLCDRLGLDHTMDVPAGRRIWGVSRGLDFVIRHHDTSLGVECKCLGDDEADFEQVAMSVRDIAAWPIPGMLVLAGDDEYFSREKGFLLSTGKAVEIEDLEDWLRLYFGLPFLIDD